MPVTQRCNLRCKDCSFMMPLFKHPVDFKADDLLRYMDKLFDAVDVIQIFRILGGEPFLYKEINRITEKALASKKVKTVEIVTNGTIIPDQKFLESLANTRTKIQISYYGELSRNAQAIKELCDKIGVNCVIRYPEEKTWFYQGDLSSKNRTKQELKKQLKHCANICRSFHNGKLYFCQRGSFGTKLGIPDDPNDFVDLTQDVDRKTLRKQIFSLNQRKFVAACNYCDNGTEFSVNVPVAEQL